MPTKQRIDPITADPHAPTSAQPEDHTLRPWEYRPTAGPQDLYRQFALHYIDQNGILSGMDDDTYVKVMAAVEAAITITLRCANVEPTWTAYYQSITAQAGGQLP